jgi:hypothetical protein
MDFYESDRFQYSASLLLVKLDIFRKTGVFPKKITYKNTPDILILPARRGSFGLEVLIPALAAAGPMIYEIPISYLFSYVADRIFKSGTSEQIARTLAERDGKLFQLFQENINGRDDTIERTLDLLGQQMAANANMHEDVKQLYERLLADQQRRGALREEAEVLRRIPPDSEANLLTMAAPLLKEMNVPLRRSASRLNIDAVANDNEFKILSANKEMADAVDTELVDDHLTRIDIDIVQFDKESGWGKFRNDEWDGRASFSIPGDILDDLKQTAVDAMHQDMVEVDCVFVRSAAGIPQRIIVSDIRNIDE